MEHCIDAISVRTSRLNSTITSRSKNAKDGSDLLSREGLLDVLQLLYDELNTDYMKICDKSIAKFVEKHRKTIADLKRLRVNLTDFEVKSVIGRGHFGDVHIVKEKQTGDVYAMKTVRKYEASGREKCASFEEERNIMVISESAWITQLQYAFQDKTNLYFIMEYHPGGDLLGLLHRQDGALKENVAIFYIAELVLAIKDLHDMGYVHRDIKPDNVLLDRCGHLKLADFGSAAKLNEKGVCTGADVPVGTPDYIAPEVLCILNGKTKSSTYGKACDYWSLGILGYELVVGHTPFSDDTTAGTYNKIMNHMKTFKFPADTNISLPYVSLIRGLLTDQNQRLVHAQLVKHAAFKSLDFNGLRESLPPFVPKIASNDDTSNFADVVQQGKKKPPAIDNFKRKTQFCGKNLPFVGFTYVSEPAEFSIKKRGSVMPVRTDDGLRREVEVLKKGALKCEELSAELDVVRRKLDERGRKVEVLEHVREELEKAMGKQHAEYQALQRLLEYERTDRVNVENKAMELIQEAKAKWQLSEDRKIAEINYDLREARERNEELSRQIDELNAKLHEAQRVTHKQKTSLENVEKLRRSSVIGLESRLERVTVETQSRIVALQQEASALGEKKVKLERELEESRKREQNLEKILADTESNYAEKLKHAEKSIAELKQDVEDLQIIVRDYDLIKSSKATLENQLMEAQASLKNESSGTQVLKKQINDLKRELNQMRNQKLSIDEQRARYETQIKDLKQTLEVLGKEKDELSEKYMKSEMSLKGKEEKLDSLEALLLRLQSNVARIESGADNDCALQKQINRLEQQLKEMHEKSALEKQEMNQLKTKHWRLEKDFSNATLDKKIVERDLKERDAEVRSLTNEIDNLKLQLCEQKKASEEAINELGMLNDKLGDEVVGLKAELKSTQEQLIAYQKMETMFDDKMSAMRKDIEAKEMKICEVLARYDKMEKNFFESEDKLAKVLQANESLVSKMDDVVKENTLLHNQLQSVKSELDGQTLNRQALRDACTVLEEQLVEFENAYDNARNRIQGLETDIEKLHTDLNQSKRDVQDARKATNEEKTMRLLAETKSKRLTEDLEQSVRENDAQKAEIKQLKEMVTNLHAELSNADTKADELMQDLRSYERQIEELVSENNYLKEEVSQKYTVIANLKESNYNLSKNVHESQHNIKELYNRVNELEDTLSEKMKYYSEREHKSNQTMLQQSKLIDYLQTKVEEHNKKKKTLSDKLFGSSKKENQPPVALALNYRDLEAELNKLREENKNLNKEVIRLKALSYRKEEYSVKEEMRELIQNQDEIIAQIVRSPGSQKNEFSRQNSKQRMHHNIPHRFENKLSTKLQKCAQCQHQIIIGSKISVCSECNAHTHQTCAANLPRTCGLPTAFALHYSESVFGKANDVDEEADPAKWKADVRVEGWVKVPCGSQGWVKHYARLTATTLSIYPDYPPENGSIRPVQVIHACAKNSERHSKVILEPLASEIPIAVATSDLQFVIKVESGFTSSCFPQESITFMTLSVEEKDKWFKALTIVFKILDIYDVIFENNDGLVINCVVDLNKDTKLFATNNGLYAYTKDKLLRINGFDKVHDVVIFRTICSVYMIVNDDRILAMCSLKHLESLSECAPSTKPSLKYEVIPVGELSAFHIMKGTDSLRLKTLALANEKQLAIMRYSDKDGVFVLQRILDAAEPVSCIVYTDHSIIVGVDKFFEIGLDGYEADEFLDFSDQALKPAFNCYKTKSFPVGILQISKMPVVEYLICFNEFAFFVDAYGRTSRSHKIDWPCEPLGFHYSRPYLYVLHRVRLEVYKIDEGFCQTSVPVTITTLDLEYPQLLGTNDRLIYLMVKDNLIAVNAENMDDTIASGESGDGNDDQFSFTSSMVQSLDGVGHSSEVSVLLNHNQQQEKKVTFTTDL